MLSKMLGHRFPLLQTLSFRGCQHIGDEGLAIFAQGLTSAPLTRLSHLDLSHVDMGDEGMVALASVVREGGLELENVNLGKSGVMDQGICALARAVEDAGVRDLPMLSVFEGSCKRRVTTLGGGGTRLCAHQELSSAGM